MYSHLSKRITEMEGGFPIIFLSLFLDESSYLVKECREWRSGIGYRVVSHLHFSPEIQKISNPWSRSTPVVPLIWSNFAELQLEKLLGLCPGP